MADQNKSTGAADAKDEQEIARARGLNLVPWCEQYERMISGMLSVKPPSHQVLILKR